MQFCFSILHFKIILKNLSFEKVDTERFPCFDLVLEAGRTGKTYPAVANGASEEAVKLFLDGKIKFNDIYTAIYGALQSFDGPGHVHFEDLVLADEFSRRYVKEFFGV